MAAPVIQQSFSKGELSPTLYARTDLAAYKVGAALMRNFYVDYRGGASTRPGTKFIVQCLPGKNRLVAFKFSTLQTYILIFSNQRLRFATDGGAVLEAPFTISAATNTNPLTITLGTGTLGVGDWVFVTGATGMTQLNERFFIVGAVTGSVYTLLNPLTGAGVDATGWGVFTGMAQAARLYTIGTPYLAADLAALKFTQSADVLTITHPSYQPQDLTRTGNTAWTLTPVSFAAAVQAPVIAGTVALNPVSGGTGIFYQYVTTALTDSPSEESVGSTPSGIFGNTALDQTKGCNNLIAITPPASGPVPSRYNIYKAEPFGTGGTPGTLFGYVGQTTGLRFTDTNIAPDFTQTPPDHHDPFANSPINNIAVVASGSSYSASDSLVVSDPMGSGWQGFLNIDPGSGGIVSVSTLNAGQNYVSPTFSVHTSTGSGAGFSAELGPASGNYPSCACYFQQRKVFAASFNEPETFWMTQTGNFKNMDVSFPVRDSDAITATLAAQQVNAIQFLVPATAGVIMFTSSGAWLVSGGGPAVPITPTSVGAQPQEFNGCNALMPPLTINREILYVTEKGASVRDITYNFFVNIYTGTDITVFSSHLFFGHQLQEWAWAEEPYKLLWAVREDGVLLTLTWIKEQEVQGWSHHDTQGFYRSVASVTEPAESEVEREEDAVYVVVERTIGVNTVQYVERFNSRDFLTGGVPDPTKPWCVDSGLQYNGAPATIISGLDHLEGMSVVALADGNVVQNLTVTNGTVVLPTPASLVTVGLPFTCQLQTLRLDTGDPTIQDKFKQISRFTVRVAESRGLQVGRTFSTLTPYKERSSSLPYNTPIPLITSDEGMPIDPLWDAAGQVCIQQSDPLPATVLGVIPWVQVGSTPG